MLIVKTVNQKWDFSKQYSDLVGFVGHSTFSHLNTEIIELTERDCADTFINILQEIIYIVGFKSPGIHSYNNIVIIIYHVEVKYFAYLRVK